MDVGKTQVFSLITKGITTALGIVQSVLIVRLLSPAEFGLVGLVLSIGSLVGVSQHLGIVDGAIREIAIRTNIREQAKIFWVSIIVRQIVTLPLSLILLLFAPLIANNIYHHPEITPYLYIFAGILIFQGFQDVLGATLTGIKNFVGLYTVQIVTAAMNIAVFGYLTWQFGIDGFFWAMILMTAVMAGWFFILISRNFASHFSFPTKEDIRTYSRAVMRVGAYMYVARIFFVLWQRLPLLILGGVLAADQLGYLNVSLTFGSRMTILAMALSEVNLSWMSSLYMHQREKFAQQVTLNLRRVFVLLYMVTITLLFFTPEILRYVIGIEYIPAEPLVYIVTTAFFIYAVVDIGTSSIFVPADNPRERAFVYGILTCISGLAAFILLHSTASALFASFTMLLGVLIAFAVMMILVQRKYAITLFTPKMWFLFVFLGVITWWLYAISPNVLLRIIMFLLVSAYVGWEAYKHQLFPTRILKLLHWNTAAANQLPPIICFSGAEYDQPSWTNRQHIMSRISATTPVLYVEPRVWVVRHVMRLVSSPRRLLSFLIRIMWYQKRGEHLYVISQWNLLPGSREYKMISLLNHWINRFCVLLKAWWLGFVPAPYVVWIYDTEAAEYLSAFYKGTVIYDCVDDHASQAGVDRNPQRVQEEESQIMKRADLVTVTSHRLYEQKKSQNTHVELVLNAGDVQLYQQPSDKLPKTIADISHPIIGTVGALDSYKVDFDLLLDVATRKPDVSFVFIGSPVVDRKTKSLQTLSQLPNVHVLGSIPHEKVPKYVHAFDVCMIPYLQNAYNEASFPLKFWEFMATGKPIIASGVPELERYKHLISYVSSSDEFIHAIDMSLQSSAESMNDRKTEALSHGWEQRVSKLVDLLKKTIKNTL